MRKDMKRVIAMCFMTSACLLLMCDKEVIEV